MKSKTVFETESCHDFMRQSFASAQKNHPGLTIQKFGRQVGIGTSSLKMILSGRRKLMIHHIHKLSQVLKLSSAEISFLESLALKERGQDHSEAHFYRQRATQIRKTAKLESIVLGQKEILQDFYTLPALIFIRDTLKQSEIKATPFLISEIATQFSILPERARKIVVALHNEQASLPAKKTGQKEIHYIFDQISNRLLQKAYLKAWMQESIVRLEAEYLKSDASFGSSTISIHHADVPQLKKELKAVIEKYIGKKGPKDSVVQLGLQLLPLTKGPRNN